MRLQIGFTGRYQGRGIWRRVFGSGPVRMTPIDVAISDNDKQEVEAAATALRQILATQEPTKHRAGSFFDIVDVRIFVQTKTT
ncbi:MAG: hypothetical protein WD716_13280 [Fimbriimonadaceae bacterium]